MGFHAYRMPVVSETIAAPYRQTPTPMSRFIAIDRDTAYLLPP
jgi:hypothetical protein